MLLRKVLAKRGLQLPCRVFFSSHSAAAHDSHSHSLAHDSHDAHDAHDSHGHGGHGHGHKPYDWRDDPKFNKELEEDIRDRGWDPETYTTPYQGTMKEVPVFPENYDASNLKVNFYPDRKKNEHPMQTMRVLDHNIGVLKAKSIVLGTVLEPRGRFRA